ncbi:MAG TPA: ABC transporter permease [Vicinamibacterales bacterium]|nr:ABC transporter permease [Vicinamibacterales bacterium]
MGPERLPGALVTGALFEVLGTRPQLGRLFNAADDRAGGEHVVVVSHGFWKRALAGRADVIGQHLQVIDGTYRIIGVLPPDFELWLTPADVFAPIAAESIEVGFRGVHSLAAVGRLAGGKRFGGHIEFASLLTPQTTK